MEEMEELVEDMKWEWWHERNQEAWYYLDTVNTDWVEVNDYNIWKDFHLAARFVIFHERKTEEEIEEFYAKSGKIENYQGGEK